MWRASPQYCQIVRYAGSLITLFTDLVYGTRRFVTAFTSARHLSLSWASSIQSIPPHATSWRSILILSSHLHLGLPSLLQVSPPNPFIRLSSPPYALHAPPISILSTLSPDYRSLSFSLCSSLRSPVTSSLLGPNILLSTLFSDTLSSRSSLDVSDQVIHQWTVCLKRVDILLYRHHQQRCWQVCYPIRRWQVSRNQNISGHVSYTFDYKVTLRRSLAVFSYSRHTICTRHTVCKLVNPSTIRSHTHLSILITWLTFLKINTNERHGTSTSTCT